LDDIRQSSGEYEENLRQLQEQIREQAITVENWKNSVGRMTNLLYEAENKAKELEKAADQARIDVAGDERKERQEGEIRKQHLQIEAYEAEVTHIHEEIEKQSRHLAEMQATLIEREISLNKSQETAERQAVQLEHVKRMAGKRIRGLEAELAQTQQKLKDLSVWLERRQRRGENLEEGKA
jgi:chromosome segregation ATPase